MASQNYISPRKFMRKGSRFNLEIIPEEKELESITLSENVSKRDVEETTGIHFTPFTSSWRKNSIKMAVLDESKEIKLERNMKELVESLKCEYDKLFQKTRLQYLENEYTALHLGNLENEFKQLRIYLREITEKFNLEQKNHQQMKTDYEFMLESQDKKFKRREKELLEIIKKCNSKIADVMDTSISDDSVISTKNTFEYEELTEKLELLEKQNETLQGSRDKMQIQNKQLQNELDQMKEAYSSLELQYNHLRVSHCKPKWLNIQLNLDKSTISGRGPTSDNNLKIKSTRTVQTQTQIKSEINRNQHETFEHKPSEPNPNMDSDENGSLKCENLTHRKFPLNKFIEDNEIVKILLKLQNILKEGNNQKSLESSSNLRNNIKTVDEYFFNEGRRFFTDSLKICAEKIQAAFKNEIKIEGSRNNTETSGKSNLDTDNQKSRPGLEEYNTMNLSDSEKIHKSNTCFEESFKYGNDDSELELEYFLYNEDIISLQENNNCMKNNSTNSDKKILALLERNKTLIEKIEKLKIRCDHQKYEYEKLSNSIQIKDQNMEKIEQLEIENEYQKYEYEKLLNSIQEKDKFIIEIKNEICKIVEENESFEQYMKYFEFFIENQMQELEKLTEMMLNVEKNEEIDIPKSQENITKIELYESPEQKFTKKKQMFVESLKKLKTILIGLKEDNKSLRADNKSLKETIKRVNTYMHETRSDYMELKDLCVNEIMTELEKFKTDIYKTRGRNQSILLSVKKEIEEKNSLILALQEKLSRKNESDHINCTNDEHDKKIEQVAINSENGNSLKSKTIDEKILISEGQQKKWQASKSQSQNESSKRNKANSRALEFRKEEKWKMNRTQLHDSRRNIDLNSLCSELSS